MQGEKKERKLSVAELKRKADFESKAEELAGEGFERKDLTISVLRANILGVAIMLPIVAVVGILYFTLNAQSPSRGFRLYIPISILPAFLLLTVVHELIHGGVWAIFAKKHLGAISFGVIWAMLTPYCTCNEGLSKVQYILGAAAPTVILGIIPAILSVIFGNLFIFMLSVLMIVAGGGDCLIILKLLFYKESGGKSIYMDHPYECGMVVFESKS